MILRTLIKGYFMRQPRALGSLYGDRGHICLVNQLFTGIVGTGVHSAPLSVLSVHLIKQRCGVPS